MNHCEVVGELPSKRVYPSVGSRVVSFVVDCVIMKETRLVELVHLGLTEKEKVQKR